jgi:hypothetical protein
MLQNWSYANYSVKILKSDTHLEKVSISHRNQSINRKGAYIFGDIHGMDHFCTKLAPPPYNKPRSCVSKIYKPMVMVWFGNV